MFIVYIYFNDSGSQLILISTLSNYKFECLRNM